MRFVLLVVLAGSNVFAQSFYGPLRGCVLDPEGAVTAAANVTLVDQGTGATRQTITNDQGEYTFASVTPSTYTVSVAAPGFKHFEQPLTGLRALLTKSVNSLSPEVQQPPIS